MPQPIVPPALVTVMVLNPYGQVLIERFEVEHVFRPMYTNPDNVYSIETHREGFMIADLIRSERVDIATWLHRAGVWDQLPPEA